MKAKCIESFSVPKFDDEGVQVENTECIVKENTIWNIEECPKKILDGDIRLTNDSGWIEIHYGIFYKCFEFIF